jgi:hypothetical protein
MTDKVDLRLLAAHGDLGRESQGIEAQPPIPHFRDH